jgi:hypothetical protein
MRDLVATAAVAKRCFSMEVPRGPSPSGDVWCGGPPAPRAERKEISASAATEIEISTTCSGCVSGHSKHKTKKRQHHYGAALVYECHDGHHMLLSRAIWAALAGARVAITAKGWPSSS